VFEAISDQFGDGNHLEMVFRAELDEVWYLGHVPVVFHNLANHPGGM
jgi:hypothetical protein